MAKTASDQLKASVVAISNDSPSESQKMDQLLNKTFPLLYDRDLNVIKPYGLVMGEGSNAMGDMGYVIIDGHGVIRSIVPDAVYGSHADRILKSLNSL